MSKIVRCDNCGAMMVPRSDGRTFKCSHCDAEMQVAVDGAQIAAGMKLDLANIESFLLELASALRHGFGEEVQVVTTGAAITSIQLDLEPHRFVVKRDKSKVVAQVKQLVRGVALKTKTHQLPDFVELLSKSIAEHVNANAKLSETLARLAIK